MINCRAIKQKKDILKKLENYKTADLALKKIIKKKIKNEILKKYYNCKISDRFSLKLLYLIILLLTI